MDGFRFDVQTSVYYGRNALQDHQDVFDGFGKKAVIVTSQFIEELGLEIRLEDAPARHNLWMDCSKAKRYGVIFSDVSKALMKCSKDNGFEIKNNSGKG